MAYQFVHSESVRTGVRRVVREKIDAALRHLNENVDIHASVHEARKRIKEIRAVLRLIRSELDGLFEMENAALREAARELAPLREAQAVVESLEKLRLHYKDQMGPRAFSKTVRRLRKRRDEIVEGFSDLPERVRRSGAALVQARARVPAWPLDSESFEALEDGLRDNYQLGRKTFRTAMADPSPENLHEWRKRVKDNWYHSQLLREIWPEMMKGYRDTLEELSQLLGEHHDLALLPALVAGEWELQSLIEARLREIEAEVRVIGNRIYADRPKEAVRRLRQYWESWKSTDLQARR